MATTAPVLRRRWLRNSLLAVASVIVLLGGALWLLGREATLQTLLHKVAAASGGELEVGTVSGSLYGTMHLSSVRYRSAERNISAEQVEISWSPLQYFTQGVAIRTLHADSLLVESVGPSQPARMPTTLAPPFRLEISAASVGKLTLLNGGVSNVITDLRLQLAGDASGWRLQQASAATPWGQLAAQARIGGARPFALDGTASLTQSHPSAQQAAAQLSARLSGDLALLKVSVTASAPHANGSAQLALTPFAPIPLQALELHGSGINPANFNPAWPQANLQLELAARIDASQHVSGTLALKNDGPIGSLDQQRLPLHSIHAQLGGNLTQTTLDALDIDFGAGGKLTGEGRIERTAPDAALGSATLRLQAKAINLKALYASLQRTAIGGQITLSSSATQQTLSALLAQDGLRLDLSASLKQQLLRIEQARLQVGKGTLNLSAQADLKQPSTFSAKLAAAHFNPAALGAYPVADLNADFNFKGQLSPAWRVAADFALRPSRVLQQPLSGAGKLTLDASQINNVDANLALGQNKLALRGAFGAPGQQLLWRLEAPHLAALRSDLAGAVRANGVLEGSMAAPHSSFQADAQGLALLPAKIAPNSVLHAVGQIGLSGPNRRLELSQLRASVRGLNPAAFGPYSVGSINADLEGAGRLGSDWQLALKLALQASTLANAPLSGFANVNANAARISNADLDLRLGPNQLQAHGNLGAATDRLDWTLAAPQLATLGPQFDGVLNGAGSVSGSLALPALNFKLNGQQLRLFGTQQIKTLRASANLSAALNAPLQAALDVSAYAMPGFALTDAHIYLNGTQAAHTLQLAARNDDFDAAATVTGNWRQDTWSGVLNTLQNRGRFPLSLQAPVPLQLTGAAGSGLAGLLHPVRLALTRANFTLAGGSLNLQSLEKNGANWRSAGQAAGVPLSFLTQLAPLWRDNASSSLTLGAQWSLNLQAPASGQPALAGMLHVFREQGDVTVGLQQPLALGLRQLDLRADILNDVLRLQVALDGARAGQIKLDGSAHLVQGHIASSSALTLNGSATMPSLAWLAPLSGQAGLLFDGALNLALSASGSIGTPLLNGVVTGQKLSLNWAEQGLKLQNGQLQAKLVGDQLQLQTLNFDGVEGKVQASGWLRLARDELSMEVKLVADKLLALARPDRSVVVSGTATLLRDQQRFQLSGKLKAERALVELGEKDTPTLSSDVVVLSKTKVVTKTTPSLPLNIDLEVDLGDAFQLKGKGLDAQLTGNVHFRMIARGPPRINGSIRVVNGTYAAYGKKLQIERGLLNFTGAYDNPGLNILAVRKGPDDVTLSETNVEAGVEVRGTALAPTAKLVSTPNVSDSDKLAWLVLGHSSEGSANSELSLLTSAAGALFGSSSGGSFQSRLASTLGVDELGVGQASGVSPTQAKGLESTVVTVGKRISQRVYLSFEQGASSASSLVKLRYKLNPRITLQFQTGANNAIDVLYNWAFD